MSLNQWLSSFLRSLTRLQARSSPHRRRPQVQEVLRPTDMAKRVDLLEDRTLLAAFFGDAPAPYPVTLAEGGAWHVFTGSGNSSHTRDDGAHTTHASYERYDGRLVGSDLTGTTALTVRGAALGATLTISSGIEADANGDPIVGRYDLGAGWLVSAWVDWNQDGDWNDAGEQIAASSRDIIDQLFVETTVPTTAKPGITYARLRISTEQDLGPTGSAPDGYVDDVQVYIAPTDAVNFTPNANGFVGLIPGLIPFGDREEGWAGGAGRDIYRDVNRDGIADAMGNSEVFLVNSQGTATRKTTIGDISRIRSWSSRGFYLFGDINGDGHIEIVEGGQSDVANSTVAVSSFDASNSVSGWWGAIAGDILGDAGVVDYNGDGQLQPDEFRALLGWAPAPIGRLDFAYLPPDPVTGFYVIDALLAGDTETAVAAFSQLILPMATLALFTLAPITRMTRGAMLQALGSDFIRTAKAAGLSRRKIIGRYAFQNAMLPVVTTLGMVFSFTLGANVLVEKVFAWPGIGSFAVEALVVSDYAAVQGFVLSMALLFVCLNLAIDILYTLIDPRVSIDG